ncbi:MAG: DNA repair protein RecO [Chlamydiae bacterium]|nr:DNA repair protein RecO [Chlamydiota bacterium]
MAEEKLKAIVLRAVPFKDRQSILTLLSEEKGIVSMIVKGLSKSRPHLIACINPLCQAEFIYTEGRSDLLKCVEASVIDTHFALREKYSFLEQGLQLAKILLESQYPGKSTPALYALFSCFLKQIPSFREALPTLSSSFLLKLLKHEGLLLLDATCSACLELKEIHVYGGDMYCKRHAPVGSFSFSEMEWKILELLAQAKSFEALRQTSLENAFREKIELYFQSRMRQV